MSITFNSTVFPVGFVGEDDGSPSAGFGIDNASQNSITINGTVTKVGDTVVATGVLPGGDDTGITTTTTMLTVTQFDNANQIEFTAQGQGGAGSGHQFRFVLSNNAALTGNQKRVTFAADPALVNGTDGDVYTAPCFATGTLIRTMRGSCAVEDLVVGDVAVAATGGTRPIVWIGHRDTDCRGLPDLQPVSVSADAFGPGLPERDLWLSQGHPVLVGANADNEGGHLVPIMCLINGTSVRRVAVDAVTYWHVELDAHDILLAEELPAESYLDWGDRPFFAENSDHRLANPDFVVPGLAGRCRQVAFDGPVVEAARRQLDSVLAMRLASAAAWPDVQNDLLAIF